LVLIALLAAFLRLDRLDLTEFRREEANALLIASSFLEGGRLPLTSIATSVAGLENGPLQVYLAIPPLVLARDPALVAAFQALLNVVAVVAAAKLAERAYGRPAGLFTASAYAVGAWAVYFSRKIWPNDPMPPFAALLALALFDAVVAGRSRSLALAGLSLGALLNLHPSSISLLPAVAVALLSRPRLLRTRGAAFGLAGIALVSAPFAWHQLREGLPASRALRQVATVPSVVDGAAFRYAADIVGPGAYAFLAGGAEELFEPRALPEGGVAVIAAAMLALGAVAALWWSYRRYRDGREWRAAALPLVLAVGPLLVASRHSIDLWIHYLIFLTPLLFVLVGLGLATVYRFVPVVAVGLAIWAGAVQVQQHRLFWEVLDEGAMRTVYGTPLGPQRDAVGRALAAAGSAPLTLVSQRPEHSGADDYLPVWRLLVPGRVPLRFDDGGGALRLAERDGLYAVAPSADPRADELLAARGGRAAPPLRLAGLPQPGFAHGYSFWRARARPLGEAGAGLARLEDGLRLERAEHPFRLEPGRDLKVSADWRIEAPPPDEELGFFVHLVDDKLRRLDGHDRAGLEAGKLDAGDQLVTWATLRAPPTLAPGRYWLMLGAYRADGTRRLDVLDPIGRPAGDFVKVGPLKVALPPPSIPTPAGMLARFEGGVELAAAELPSVARPAELSTLKLTWRATGRPPSDLTVFVHVLDPDGRPAAQDDRPPIDGGYPTSIWEAGETIVDVHPMVAPTAPGRFRVVAGMYDPNSGTRLKRFDGGTRADAVEIGTLTVAP
jgi:hypothetical protein